MKTKTIAFLISALFVSTPSYALFGLGSDKEQSVDTAALTSLATSALSDSTASVESSPIVKQLTDSLGVSPTQASGGAGALLALASNSLSGSQSSELTNLIPGMSSLTESVPGLMGMANNLSAVNDVFAKLGLDPSMVAQFAPIIMEYLTGQGASSGLLGSLSSIWK
ncbi:DUF2780 domain-containing protein [Vibrio tapetis subsp. quintayensis]|uniref:DUF2780 domain-containing protein n=1 Tax=Vibrio tapetis TaxID=52443 RepID=UPI0025B5CF32|nr:DUF2780 domain-containing protein [Vibrio tapetis]MDN3679040.1 DUF2780 domain-containing protein [Vibrio tapetis subsp. quintayensis]